MSEEKKSPVPGIYIVGTVNCKNLYTGGKSPSYSLDLVIPGCRTLINVGCSPEFYNNVQEGSVVNVRAHASSYNGSLRLNIR